ncbi:MAG: calcium/sodium antiporter [Oscillospiraceae bacterium]|nr:calcium/sodium antiporter [Oscillospiraceae bacterium]
MLYVLLIVGFVLLIKGADFFVDGASVLARRFHIPTVVIGLTIAALGTSLPECAVSITAGVAGNADIAISNVVGSNLANLLLVLGLSALMRPLSSLPALLRRDFPWCLAASAALAALCFTGRLSRPMGFALLAACVIYLFQVVRSTLRGQDAPEKETDGRRGPAWWIVLTIVGGLAAIVFGGQLVVNNAQAIALAWGMSERMVGLTIVAIGTSLPELVTSVVAARKGECDLAIGNVVGSSLLNILFILGVAASIVPISVSPALRPDVLLMVAAAVLVFLFCRLGRTINRLEGLICTACYGAYIVFLIVR